MRLLLAFAAFALLVGCQKKLDELYCEGGVRDGKGDGGECLFLTPMSPEGNGTTVATAHFSKADYKTTYEIRRTSKDQYDLYVEGVIAGSMVHDGNWLKLTFKSDPKTTYKLRSDLPGPFA